VEGLIWLLTFKGLKKLLKIVSTQILLMISNFSNVNVQELLFPNPEFQFHIPESHLTGAYASAATTFFN